MFSISYTVHEKEITPPYNHVHHGDALKILEKARAEFLASAGASLESLMEEGILLVITNVNATYLREVRPGELTATCEAPHLEDKTIILHQRLINLKGKDMIRAQVSSQCLSIERRRAVYPPERLIAALKKG